MAAAAAGARPRCVEATLAVGRVPQYSLTQQLATLLLPAQRERPSGAGRGSSSRRGAARAARADEGRATKKRKSSVKLSLIDSDEEEGDEAPCDGEGEVPLGRAHPQLAHAAIATMRRLHAAFPPVLRVGCAADGAVGGVTASQQEVLKVCAHAWLPIPQMPGMRDFEILMDLGERVRKAAAAAVDAADDDEPAITCDAAIIADALLWTHTCCVLADDADERLKAFAARPKEVLLTDAAVYRMARIASYRLAKGMLFSSAVRIASSPVPSESTTLLPCVAAAGRLVCAWCELAFKLGGESGGLRVSHQYALDHDEVSRRLHDEYRELDVAHKVVLLQSLRDPRVRMRLVRCVLLDGHADDARRRVVGLKRIGSDAGAYGAGAMLEYVAEDPQQALRSTHTRGGRADKEEELISLVATMASTVAEMLRATGPEVQDDAGKEALVDAARNWAPRAAQALRAQVEASGGSTDPLTCASMDCAVATSARAALLVSSPSS